MKVILVVGAFTEAGLTDVVHQALRFASAAQKQGVTVFAPCLDRRIGCLDTDVAEVHRLEKEAIARKFPDEVYFTDPDAPDVAELVALAREMGYAL